MKKLFALAIVISIAGLTGCATADTDPAKSGTVAKPTKDSSSREDREPVTGSRLPRRDS